MFARGAVDVFPVLVCSVYLGVTLVIWIAVEKARGTKSSVKLPWRPNPSPRLGRKNLFSRNERDYARAALVMFFISISLGITALSSHSATLSFVVSATAFVAFVVLWRVLRAERNREDES